MKPWQDKLLDRMLAAFASAIVMWVIGYLEKAQLQKDIRNLQWGVEYFRTP